MGEIPIGQDRAEEARAGHRRPSFWLYFAAFALISTGGFVFIRWPGDLWGAGMVLLGCAFGAGNQWLGLLANRKALQGQSD